MKNLILIGFRAAGKTTLAHALAKAWGWSYLDLDEVFERKWGPISHFVDENGVQAFRHKEFEVLTETLATLPERVVISTGGGIVDEPQSLQALQHSPIPKVFLHWPADTLWQRLSRQPERQKVLHLDSLEAVSQLLAARLPKYNKIATYTLDSRAITDSLEILGKIIKNG